jgi:tetratricopeptide (TPR) repeat protein
MNEPHDPNRTVDEPSAPDSSLDPGLAAGFGRPADGPGSVLSELRDRLGDLRPVLLQEAKGDSAHVVKPKSDAMPPPEQSGDRYQLQGEIARGGMGVVLRGRDVDLGRDLAVKVLLEKYADRPEVARRFIEEAQIGGQLQHPGVVPVYDIGRFGERPFFTMKLVKGQTLQALLGQRPDLAADRPRFLADFLKVTQTLAYAHAKGVIHRDLKPANIMVGAFGEVQVMDWGLAKVLAEGGTADEERASRQHQPEEGTQIRTARSSGSSGSFGIHTEDGSLLGTPAYMPPEQANGEVALLDRRADVFGLGAILCEILTGKPPYLGRSLEEMRRKAANGDLADATARLDACGADHELIALTKACLAPEVIDRPRDAQAVADSLAAYLNGVQERVQTAQRERAVALAREAEQAKRRKVQLALAATLVALLLGGGVFAWWRNAQAQAGRERDARNAEAVAALLGQAEEALQAGDAAKAQVALDAAKKRSGEGGAEKETERLGRLEADLALLRDLDAIDQFRWTWSENQFPNPAVVATQMREALTRYGADLETASADEAAARVSASVVRERIVLALDRLLQQRTAGVRALLRRVDTDPYRDAARDVALAKDRAKLAELAGQAAALEQPAEFAAFLGESPAIPVERRRQLLQAALSRRPRNLGLLMTLGGSYPIDQKETADPRLRWYQAAVAASSGNAAAHNNLGVALHGKGQVDEAIACFHQALAFDPKLAPAHNNLGTALSGKDQVDEAITCWRQAIALDSKLAGTHVSLGHALQAKGQVDEAIACFKKALALDPQNARAHNYLGSVLCDRKRDYDEAIACFHKAIALDPKYAHAHNNLGVALRDKGQVDEAITCWRQAIALDPKFAPAHTSLGMALFGKGQRDEAIACFHQAIALDPKNALAHNNLGMALFGKGQRDEAIACFHKAIDLDPKLASAHNNLGSALSGRGRVDEAIACYHKAIAIDPKYASAHNNLGLALKDKGQLDEAIACSHKAIALDPKYVAAHYSLGLALKAKGRLDEAIARFRQAIALDPKHASAHIGLGNALSDKGQLDEAIACFHQAIALDPKGALAHNGLGLALGGKGQADEAIACYRQAIALDPKLTSAHCNLGDALKARGQWDEAITCFRRATALDPKQANPYVGLGQALLGKGRYPEACDASARALELFSDKHPLRPFVFQLFQMCERFAKLEERLPRLLTREDKPASVGECLDAVTLCRKQQRYAAAARFAADAFAADPRLADFLKAGHRYTAACCAALAAAGQGQDAGQLDDQERSHLRQQALSWLRADLALWGNQLQGGKGADRTAVQKQLRHWQQDADLSGLRDKTMLEKLPAEEQKAFTQLWADVAALLKKAETAAPKEGKP